MTGKPFYCIISSRANDQQTARANVVLNLRKLNNSRMTLKGILFGWNSSPGPHVKFINLG